MSADSPSVRHHPLFARFYARVSPLEDRGGFADRRRQLLAGLRGRVIAAYDAVRDTERPSQSSAQDYLGIRR